MLDKKENVRNIVSLGIYSLCTLFFLILVFVQETLSEDKKELFIGWPLIVLVSLLILSNYVISMIDTIKAMKKRCKRKRTYGKSRGPSGQVGQELEKEEREGTMIENENGLGPTGIKSKKKLIRVKKKDGAVPMIAKGKLRVEIKKKTKVLKSNEKI